MNREEAYVKLDKVSKIYKMGEVEIRAVDEISFEISKGEFVVIVGPSGAGKTTVLNILGGMDTASRGLVQVDGRNITDYNSRQLTAYRRDDIGFVFQFYNLVPNLTALENVELAMQICKNPLDATSVHPESYEAAQKLLEKLGYAPEDIAGGKLSGVSKQIRNYKKLAEELGVGELTLRDIVKELEKPARDPRDEMPKPVLRTDVLDMKDLKEGMILKGTVRNVIDFGAFVDIGVHQDGLVHISEMSEKYIKHPLEAVSVGDVVDVRVIGVDLRKKRISLSMKGTK